jgi:hypothetical protein
MDHAVNGGEGTPVTAVATQQNAAVAIPGQAYITRVLLEFKQAFELANDGLDLDFVRMGKWLVVNKLGKFVESDGKGTETEVNLGEFVDVVIATGEKQWSLWGDKEKTPELENIMIVSERLEDDAKAAFRDWLANNEKYVGIYTEDDVQLRYRAMVVPVNTIKAGEFPTVYLVSFSPTATISYGQWAKDLFLSGDKPKSIPKGLGINNLVTRLGTKEMHQRTNSNITWAGITFAAMGVFNPKEYGLQ